MGKYDTFLRNIDWLQKAADQVDAYYELVGSPPIREQEIKLFKLIESSFSSHFSRFVIDFHETDLIDKEYQDKVEMYDLSQFEYDEDMIATADWDILRTILTFYIRADYWVEGTGIDYIIDKRYLKVMLRLRELINSGSKEPRL
jgi:hypothetical protein